MDDYLSKPLEMQKLKEMLRKQMPEREAEPAINQNAENNSTPEASPALLVSDNDALDLEALTGVFGDDPETIKEILSDFVEPAKENIQEIADAYAEHSAAGVAQASHKLKSSARSVGAQELADLCAVLEKAGKADEWDEINTTVPKLATSFGKVADFIYKL